MIRKIIFFAGLSGSGKTTFLKKLAETTKFRHVSAGSLIARGRQLSDLERDRLRDVHIEENQQLLISGFRDIERLETNTIIIDGHLLIEAATGLELVPFEVFDALCIDALIHLTTNPAVILERRKADTLRSRPSADIPSIERLQAQSVQCAFDVATKLGIEMIQVSDSDQQKLLNVITV